jgi:hypothetical protein
MIPPLDHPETTLELLWTQGAKPETARGSDWQERLYHRLTATAEQARTNTNISEVGLGLPPCAYMFAHTTMPCYGSHVVVYQTPRANDFQSSPFDTGGVFHGRLPGTCLLTDEQKCELVAVHTWAGRDILAEFTTWGQASFAASDAYTRGEPPTQGPRAPQVAATPPIDRHSWTWEGRLPLEDVAELPERIVWIVVDSDTLKLYQDWVSNWAGLDEDQQQEQLNLLARCHVSSDGQADGQATIDELERVLLWGPSEV